MTTQECRHQASLEKWKERVAEQTAVPCSAAAILQVGNIRVMIKSGADAGVVRTIIEALKSC